MATSPAANQYALERPIQRRYAVQRDIAEGKLTRAAIAKKYRVTAPSITEFANRHADAIAEMASNIEDEYAGLWIADKRSRLQVYQANAEVLQAEIDRIADGRIALVGEGTAGDDEGEPVDAADVSAALARLNRGVATNLKSAAEERGQLPTRMLVKAEEGGANHFYGIDIEKV